MQIFLRFGIACMATALVTTPALALADYFTYQTENGTLAYTDELKRVPARYRDSAKRHLDQSFWNYSRLTPVPKGASYAPAESVFGDTETAEFSSPTTTSSDIQIQADRDLEITVPEGEGPVKVTRRTVWERGASRRQVVVSRGDETVAVIDRPDLYLSE